MCLIIMFTVLSVSPSSFCIVAVPKTEPAVQSPKHPVIYLNFYTICLFAFDSIACMRACVRVFWPDCMLTKAIFVLCTMYMCLKGIYTQIHKHTNTQHAMHATTRNMRCCVQRMERQRISPRYLRH